MAVVRTGMATAVTTGTGSVTATLSAAQAPVGSLVIATYTSTSAAATVQTGFTNTNPSFTVVDLAGPTGSSTLVAAKIQTEAGVSCTTNDAGSEKRLNLQAYVGHDGTIPEYTGSAQHIDTGNMRTSAASVNAGTNNTMTNGDYDGSIVQLVCSYLRPTSGAVAIIGTSGNVIDSTFTNPTNGTNPTNPTSTGTAGREMRFAQDTSLGNGALTGRYGATMSNTGTSGTYPLSLMAVLIKADPGIVTQTVTDTSTLTDTSAVSMTDEATDTSALTDTSNLAVNHTRTDTSTLTDTASVEQFAVPKNATDSATLTDTSSVLQILYYNAVDEATQLDAATIAASMLVSDTLTVTDTSSITASTPVTDTATQTDSASINVQASDSATQVEQTVQISQELLDSATQSEGIVRINVAKSDTLTLSETVVTNHPARDTHTLSESVSIQGMSIDQATLSESATVFVVANTDDQHFFFDAIRRLRTEPLPTEDPFPSYEPAYTRKRSPFRVLAQDIFTKRFLHMDVPLLGDPTLTYTLSGPNMFQSVLNWEAPSLQNLEFPLEPYRTWLHVEEDEVIRMSTILQPFIDDNKSRQRVIEGVGFSWYPKEIFYQGEEYKGIQVDPASVIRLIWAHIQSYQNGNLGVVVSSTSTPVRIGTAPKNVEFETGAGESVAFEAGPYNLNWWEVKNLGSEIDKLMKETPIESYENSYWNRDRTDILHRLELGYPRVGTRQEEIYFQEGMNLTEIIPKRNENKDVWKSDIIIVGAGEGSKAIRAYASENTGRLRRTEVLENQDITDQKRAQAIADFEKQRRRRSRYTIDAIVINAAHSNAPWGSFIAGDDILVEGTVIYDGRIQDWHRITSYTYKPKAKRAVLSLSPSESFTYGQIPEVD